MEGGVLMEKQALYAIPRTAEALPSPPKSLKKEGKALWNRVVEGFELEPYQMQTLRLACECLDRIEACRQVLQREGLMLQGRFGAKAHPLTSVEKDNKTVFARLLREIGLDAMVDSEATRPKPLYGGRRR
jgi:P27 family predicted phage terminase small subunit